MLSKIDTYVMPSMFDNMEVWRRTKIFIKNLRFKYKQI